MPKTLKWTLNVAVLYGPKISASDTVTIEAYDKVEVVVAAGAAAEDVQLQPGGAGQVQFQIGRAHV